MSVTVKQKKNLPLLPSRLRKMGDTISPHMKGQLSARPMDSFKSQKIRGDHVTLLLKFLQESFDLAPTTTPADMVCKLRLKMSSTDNKIKMMTEEHKDHDVLLFDVQEELNLGSEVNAVRTARSFKKYIRTSKEHTAYLEKTIKGNEALLKTCKEIAGVSGHHAPAGLASYFSSTWSRQRHVISKLNNTIQELKENGNSLSKKDSKADLEESILDLARAMDVDTSNSHISTIVTEMKGNFISMKNDVINLNDKVKVKKEAIKNIQDLEKTKTNRIVELENELDHLKTRNNYQALDLKQAQEERKSATNLVSDIEHKIRDLQIDNDRKALEIEGLLQRYEEAGEVVTNLQSELDDTKQLNQFLNLQIKALDNAKVNDIADWEQQKKELNSKIESLRTAEFQANAQVLSLKLELGEMKVHKDDAIVELKKIQTSEPKKDNHILELEKEIAILQKQKQELETNLEVHDRRESKGGSLVLTLQRKFSDLEKEKKDLTSQLQRMHKEKDDLISQHEAAITRVKKEKGNLAKLHQGLIDQRQESISLIQRCSDEYESSDLLLRRTTERLQSALREKEILLTEHISHASEVSRLKSKLNHLKSKLKDEKEKHRVMTKNASRKEKVANAVVTQEDNKGKITAMTREVGKLREKIAHLKTKMADISTELEQSQHDCQEAEKKFSKATQQLKEFESRMEVVEKEKNKLSSQIKDIQKDKKELDNQLTAVKEEKEQLQSRAESMEEGRDDLSAQLSETRKQYQELEEGFAAVYAEKQDLQLRTVSLEKEKDELSAQLSEGLQQYQEPEQSFTVEDQEGDLEWDDEIESLPEDIEPLQDDIESLPEDIESLPEDIEPLQEGIESLPEDIEPLQEGIESLLEEREPLQEEIEPLQEEREPLQEGTESFQPHSDSFKEERIEQKFQLRKGPKQRQVLGEKIQVIRKKTDPEKKQPDSQAEKQDDLSTQLEEANKKYQDLEEEFDILDEEKLEFQALADNLADDNYKLSTELGQAYTERHALEDKLNSLEAEGEKQELATKLKEENNLLSTSLGSMRNLCKHLHEEIEILTQTNEELRQETTSVESQEDEVFKELEKSMALCQILQQKVAAAAREKAEFEEETLKWEKENADLLTQLQSSQKQYQELEGKAFTMVEMLDLLGNKVFLAENRQKQLEEELQSMKASVAAAAIQYGVVETVGDSICITDLFQALEDMKQLNSHMKLEIANLKKTKETFEEMISIPGLGDPLLECGDSAVEKSPGERERCELKEMLGDFQYQTCKQESLIKKLRYQLSVFHKDMLHEMDSVCDNMNYIDRAVVDMILSDVEVPVIKPEDLSFLVGADVDEDDDLIGKGTFGKVFLRQYQGEAVAVKVPYISEGVRDEDDEKRMVRIKADHARTTMEAHVNLAFADHPSFPKTVGIVDIGGVPSLVLEFLGDKNTGTTYSLSQAIKFQIPALSKENWFVIIMDIIHGLKAMHEKGLLHNDLKGNNILLQWDLEDQRWHAFIIDMGKVSTQTIPLRHKLLPKEELEGYKRGILFPHLAPEYILDLQPMTVQTDIYSLGKVLARIEKVIRSRPVRDLAAEMTHVKPRLRPSWKHIKKVITKAQRRNLS